MEKLSAIECRVLGTLVEKSLTTPQAYPLSLNALTNGCNQKSAREPETSYSDQEVMDACTDLKRRSMVTEFFGAGARVSKFEEAMTVHLDLNKEQAALLAELMLRGPQGEGELRARASRMAPLPDLAALHAALDGLSSRQPPLVRPLSDPMRSRGVRWEHALSDGSGGAIPPPQSPTAEPSVLDRLAGLEARVSELEKRAAQP